MNTEFDVKSPFVDRYEEQTVGAGKHKELWIPAEDLEEMNENLQGPIRVIDIFYGGQYMGLASDSAIFQNKQANEQLGVWCEMYADNAADACLAIREHWKYIYVNFKYWAEAGPDCTGISRETKEETLRRMKKDWEGNFPGLPLLAGHE